MNIRLLAYAVLSTVCSSLAADTPAGTPSAANLAAELSSLRQDPATYVRLRMDIKTPSGTPTVLQIQIKERHTKGSAELMYQVLWPKERKGESVLLRKADGRGASGAVWVPPDAVRTLDSSKMKEAIFGSDLSYEDIVDDFFAWEQQALVGNEPVNRVNCVILESKPGKGEHSSFARIRTWVDAKRMVPLRIEKYGPAGQLLRRIETMDVVKDGSHYIPAKLSIQGSRKDSLTELDGSRIKHDVTYSDQDFSAEALKLLTIPRSAP